MDLGLREKVALISGGASGIGEATVRLLVAEGMRVAFADLDAKGGISLASELQAAGCPVLFCEGDLIGEAACRAAVDAPLQTWGRLDLLVNNAGVNDGVGLERSPADFLSSLRLNLFPAYALTHFARVALCQAQGAIVNVSSKVSVTGQGQTSGYAAAKGGLNALTREWAVGLASHNVRVNCVVPAECDTPQYERWFQSLPDPAGARTAIESLVPLERRLTRPQEVAAAIAFLASSAAAHITGELIFVDGGYTHLDRAVSHSHQKWGPK
jgi:NAD(P)-dependent dehydrogenase (short-subunit alcohol dehydrogenase family)